MKRILSILTLALTATLASLTVFPASAHAEDPPGLTNIPAQPGTNISITRGEYTDRDYDILNGKAEIVGDANVLSTKARDSWKKACTDWKAELKEMNKDNVLAANCNTPRCSTESNQTTCTSNGDYQIRVKVKK